MQNLPIDNHHYVMSLLGFG